MSRITQYQGNFAIGEIDPLLQGRIDIEQYNSALDRAKNVVCMPQGGFERRPGLHYLQDLSSHIGASFTTLDALKLVPFTFSTTESYMLVFCKYDTSNTRMFVYSNGVLVSNINSSGNDYLVCALGDIDLDRMYTTQNADTLILVHEDMSPKSIVRGASNSTWTFSTLSLTSPKHAFTLATSNPSATLTPNGVSGAVQVVASSGVFASSNVDQYINITNGFGRARVVEYVNSTTLKVITEVPFYEKDVAIASGSWELETGYEDAVSNTRGWFRTCTFHEGRLYMGGSKSLPNSLFGSKVSQYFDLKVAEGLDDDAIFVTLTTDTVNAITAMRSGRDLQIFTKDAEFFVPQADLDPITPSNIVVKNATKRGAKEGIKPVSAEGGTLFIQREGKAIREFLFSDVDLSYQANNISLLASHLLKTPRSIALRVATSTDDGDLLLITNDNDGTMAVFSILRSQNVVASSEFVTDGNFLEVGVDGSDIYTICQRVLPTNVSNTITVTDYANIAVGTQIVLKKHDGTTYTIQSEAAGGSSPSSASGNTHYFRPNTDNNTTADNIYTAINAISGFTVSNPSANVVTVVRDDDGLSNVTVTSSDATRLAVTDFVGTTKRYLELFDEQRSTDSNIQYFSGATAPDQSLPGNTTCSNLSHLEGNAVNVIRDNFVLSNKTVSSGAITLDETPTSFVEVGLPYEVEVKTLPAEPRLPSGASISRKKRILEVTPVLHTTQNLAINGFEIPFITLPYTLGTIPTSFTGRKRIAPLLGYSDEAQITFTMTQPLFATVLSVEYKLSTGT